MVSPVATRLCSARGSAALLRNCAREVGPLRGAEDAGGHAAKVARGRAPTRPDRARRFAGDVAHGAAEGAEAAPADEEGDLGHGTVGVAQLGGRALDAPRDQVAVWRQSEGLLERAREMRLGDTADAGETADRPLLVRGGVHPVLRPQQPAQQARVLAGARRAHARAAVSSSVTRLS